MNRKRIKYVVPFLLILGIGVCSWLYYSRPKEPKIEFKVYPEGEFTLKLFGDHNQYVLFEPKDNNIYTGGSASNNYFMTSEAKIRNDENADDLTFEDGEYQYVYLYDLNNHFKKEKIDIVKLFKKHQLSGFLDSVSVLTYQNRDYIALSISKEKKSIHKLLDIKTKQLSDAPKEILYGDYLNSDDLYLEVSSETELFNVLKQNNKIYQTVIYHTFYIEAYAKSKPELEDSKLLQEEPELAKALQNGGVLYTRSEMVDAKTWFNTLLHWFAPKGQDVLEVYATAEDGTKTQIKSYDEFVEWRKTHPRTN